MGKCLYKRFIWLKNFNYFFMFLFRWRKGGVALMHVYVWEHIVSLFFRTSRWIFTKLGRDEALMVPYKCFCFSVRSVQGRIQGGVKIGHGVPLVQRTSSSDRNLQRQTKCIAMIYKHVGRSVVIFGSIPKSNFWRVLDIFFGLVILPYFYAISIDFWCG